MIVKLKYLSIAALFVLIVGNQDLSGATTTTPVDLLITNGLVVTMDREMTVVEDGAIAVNKGEIIAIGPTITLQQNYQAEKSIDAVGKIVMPGLVNTHTHAAMTIFRGMADDLPLDVWLQSHIWPAEAKFINTAAVRTGANLAIAEMIRSGTTTFADMYFFSDTLAQAVKQAGMRAVIGEAVIDFPTPDSRNPQESFAIIEKLAETWRNDPLISIAIAPHAPYTCSPETLLSAKKMADRLGLPLMIHVAETKKEVLEIAAKYGATPFEHLKKIGFLGGTVIVAHAVYSTPGDIVLMTDNHLGVAHNPVSNMKLASGVAPIPEMLQAGVAVGLGTDGAASNNSLNMFKEMNAAALLQKVTRLDPTALIAGEAVKAATIGGAKVLGMEARIGSLEQGKRADLILIDPNHPGMVPLYNVYSHLVYAASGADVATVIIDGRVVMLNRKLLTVNEESVMAEANKLALKIGEFLRTK
jgi:5-methylthioadenosine/S-adenosylhomocysteine deaminase